MRLKTMSKFSDMLAIMAGDRKTLEKYIPKEPKTPNKEGKFIKAVGGKEFPRRALCDELSIEEHETVVRIFCAELDVMTYHYDCLTVCCECIYY